MKVFSTTPFVSVELLTYMEEQFPDKLPKDSQIPIDALRILQGQQMVIEKLRQLHNNEDDEDVQATQST